MDERSVENRSDQFENDGHCGKFNARQRVSFARIGRKRYRFKRTQRRDTNYNARRRFDIYFIFYTYLRTRSIRVLVLVVVRVPTCNIARSQLFTAPSGAPRELRITAKSATELNITWEAPSKDLWNGNLLGYNVSYHEISDQSVSPLNSSSSSFLKYNTKTVDIGADFGGQSVIGGLDMYTLYSVVVQAFNSRGSGPFSDPCTGRTDEGGSASIAYSLVVMAIRQAR